jgi:hypothetical protein
MADRFVHVVDEGGKWVVQVEGSARPRTKHATQAEAISAGRSFSPEGEDRAVDTGATVRSVTGAPMAAIRDTVRAEL